jgi:hypothetical protein
MKISGYRVVSIKVYINIIRENRYRMIRIIFRF